jgi:hypothetical protein
MLLIVAVFPCGAALRAAEPKLGHPRLYFTANDLPRLRAQRGSGQYQKMWKNIQESADWCLTLTPRKQWIAPVSPDPIYENLYDRFYAIMGDLAVAEHLAFAYALSGDERYGEGARQWVLASCRAWRHEADGPVDGSKAYAVCRFLKGVAVGYDVAYDCFSETEREEIRETLGRITRMYYTDYFATPAKAGPGFHTHHAIVEWASFGVAALALLGETPDAKTWLEDTVTKFEKHLLPSGLAADGSQTEGATFWASTMQYRLFFMDALRRVTGKDLFGPYEEYMNADLALASVAAEKHPGYNRYHQTVVHEPSYGQLDYYSPVLVKLAREYRRPIFQHLALWDNTLGSIQKTRYATPTKKITLLFEFGGYAYIWYDPTVPAAAGEKRLSYHFPSVREAYARASWRADDLLVGVSTRNGAVIHAGGHPVLIEQANDRRELPVKSVEDDGSLALIRCEGEKGQTLKIELDRPRRRIVIRRQVDGGWNWWCQGNPTRKGNLVTWDDRVRLSVTTGKITAWEPNGYSPKLFTGMGKLPMADPAPDEFPLATIRSAEDGQIVVEVRMTHKGTGKGQ